MCENEWTPNAREMGAEPMCEMCGAPASEHRVHLEGNVTVFNCPAEVYTCTGCGEIVSEEEVVWADCDGTLNTDSGEPWCVGCAPNQPQYVREYKGIGIFVEVVDEGEVDE